MRWRTDLRTTGLHRAGSVDVISDVRRKCSMIESSSVPASPIRYELQFTGLFNTGRGYAFPCDAQGNVDVDALTDRGRSNYFFARAVVGIELSAPTVSPVS